MAAEEHHYEGGKCFMSKFTERLKNIGPGALVAAAFIGPGTVTTCTKSGASAGYTLLWAMLFSTIATIVFQEMAARLGIVTRKGLGENIRERISNPVLKWISIIIVIVAIFIGNCAYETGNITGGILGIKAIAPGAPTKLIVVIIAALAIALLFSGSYKAIEKVLTGIVIIMSVVFIVTAIGSSPDWGAVLKGLFTPSLGENNLMTVVGLIGTTVVPYNLFLHASSSSEKWASANKEDVVNARIDAAVSIGLGGIVSMCIIIAASANIFGTGVEVSNGADMALAVEPILGTWAKVFIAIGLLAAGFTSAITAPLSAAFATQGALGWEKNMKDNKFRAIWLIVILLGAVLAIALGSSPTQLILVAQAANAIILPLIAFFVMFCVNQKSMGEFKNGIFANVVGVVIIIICCFICYRNFTGFLTSLQALIAG